MYKLPVYLRLHVPDTACPAIHGPAFTYRLSSVFDFSSHTFVRWWMFSFMCVGRSKMHSHTYTHWRCRIGSNLVEVHFTVPSAGVENWTSNPPIDGAHWSTAAPTFRVRDYYYPACRYALIATDLWFEPQPLWEITVRLNVKKTGLSPFDAIFLS